MDRAAPSTAPRRPGMADLMAEIWHVVQDLPVFFTASLFRQWHLRWGATVAEATAELPGDTLVPAAQYRSTRAITIDAPASKIWPWLVQVGCLRGGFYSDDLLDNLAHPSATTIIPEFQHLEIGQLVPMSQDHADDPQRIPPPAHVVAVRVHHHDLLRMPSGR